MRSLISLMILLVFTTAEAGTCSPTPSRTAGTHYQPIITKAVDVGRGLLVKGRVLAADTCKPIAGAKIAHWQAGANGQYQDRLRAYLYSNRDGSYGFNTEWPAMTIPHIHFRVSAKGYQTLTTQWVGDQQASKIQFNIVLQPEKRRQRRGRYR